MAAESVVIAGRLPAKMVASSGQMARAILQGAGRTHSRIMNAFSQKSDSKKSESGSGKGAFAIVDDEPDLISIYSHIVKSLGFDPIFIATEGEEIVRAIADGRASPGVIIMDYRLPGMNGIEAAKMILAQRPTIKVIIASADESVRQEALSLGFSFLQKPFSMAAFGDKIRVISQSPPGP
jgi:CheY-like chemotaxis protein